MSHPVQPAGHDPVPQVLLIAIAGLLVATLLAVAGVRWSGRAIHAPDAPTVSSRLLRFDDLPDGGITVVDARSGVLLRTLQGEQGFLRGALRALARERRARDIGAQPPFELAARADGRLSLTDTATGTRVDLESFGPANVAVFARLIDLPAPPVTTERAPAPAPTTTTTGNP